MRIDILNPGWIRICGHGSGNEHPCNEQHILTPQSYKVYKKGRTNYNWAKFWRKPKVNISKLKSIIRKEKNIHDNIRI